MRQKDPDVATPPWDPAFRLRPGAARTDEREKAQRLAERLTDRLRQLREAESRRPFYQYRNLYHDPQGASDGTSIVRSPLAAGPADPLVRCYFQVDPVGRVTLPTLNDELPELNEREDLALQRVLREELRQLAGRIDPDDIRAETRRQIQRTAELSRRAFGAFIDFFALPPKRRLLRSR